MDNNKPINRIKVMLAERMMSNKELAEKLGKDPATVSKWVTNTSQPSLENLIEIAKLIKTLSYAIRFLIDASVIFTESTR